MIKQRDMQANQIGRRMRKVVGASGTRKVIHKWERENMEQYDEKKKGISEKQMIYMKTQQPRYSVR